MSVGIRTIIIVGKICYNCSEIDVIEGLSSEVYVLAILRFPCVNGDAAESFRGQSVVEMELVLSAMEEVSDLYTPAADTYLLFCHVQPPPRSAVPHA